VWSHFLALPLVVRILGLLGIVGAAAYAWLKRKVIGAATGALASATRDKFWGYVRKQVNAAQAAPALVSQKTYKGKFQCYNTYSNYPHETFFELVEDGDVLVKVPVWRTNFFTGVPYGTLVEVDTQVALNSRAELVRRVRVVGSVGAL
jgi:hypothetical protein